MPSDLFRGSRDGRERPVVFEQALQPLPPKDQSRIASGGITSLECNVGNPALLFSFRASFTFLMEAPGAPIRNDLDLGIQRLFMVCPVAVRAPIASPSLPRNAAVRGG